MRITGNNSTLQVMNTYKKNDNIALKPLEPAKSNMALDKIEISSKAKDMQLAFNALQNTSDIREEKVAEIMNRIKSGNYEINSEAIAKKMLGLE